MKKQILSSLVVALLASNADASITINVFAGRLNDGNGNTLTDGSLLQLVNLGANGVFDSVDISDANGGTSLGQWVSGDDSLINFSFGDAIFSSATAFDLKNGNDAGDGAFQRSFTFATGAVSETTKLGLRWFPGILATNFGVVTLAAGQRYGQFTNQAGPILFVGTLWTAPADGAVVQFDSLANSGVGGPANISTGNASFSVIPEPASIALSLMGAAGLTMLRRRRA